MISKFIDLLISIIRVIILLEVKMLVYGRNVLKEINGKKIKKVYININIIVAICKRNFKF